MSDIDPDWSSKDFYAVLGVDGQASPADIKSAYRKLARENHPDLHGGVKSDRFTAIAQAYEVLGDEQRRKQYDDFKADALDPHTMFSFDHINISDLFPGQGFGTNDFPLGFSMPGPNEEAELNITFEQALAGVPVTINGNTINLPVGVEDGATFRIRGAAQLQNNRQPGDLLLTVHVKPHRWFSRQNNDLLLTLPVTFDELVLGATVEVPVFPSGAVKLRIPAGTPQGRRFRVAGRGLHLGGVQGDLLVTVSVSIPKTLPPEAKAAVETYRDETRIHEPRNIYDR